MAEADRLRPIVSLYEGPMFEQWASGPIALHPWEVALVRTYCGRTDAAILNIGCGAGRETLALYELGYHNVRGIDCAPALLEIAARRAKERNWPIEFHKAPANALPFADESFDVVTLFENVYGHITPRAARVAALRELHRVLRPGGLVFLEATSLLNDRRYWLAILALNLLRRVRNPLRMEPRDKRIRGARKVGGRSRRQIPRSHWFEPTEVPAEAAQANLAVVRSTTQLGILRDPRADRESYRREGRLLYVLSRRASPGADPHRPPIPAP
jgi:SAM-dependent methyltransferase